MKKVIIVLMLLQGFVATQAQDATKKLLKNKNITWVAEVKSFISFEANGDSYSDRFYLEEGDGNNSSVQVLKYTEDALCEESYSGYFLSSKINNGLESGKLKAYNEKGQKISENVLDEMTVSLDTFITFNPDTYEEVVEIAKGKVFYDWYEVTLVYYYNTKKNKMESMLKSLAPIVRAEKTKNQQNGLTMISNYESFVIPMNQAGVSELGINSSEVIWSKLSDMETVDFSKAKVLKGNTALTMQTVFRENILAGKYNGFQIRQGCDKDIVDADWIREYESAVDTLISFNPDTFEETVEIIDYTKEDRYNDIHLLGARHYWYWDAEKNTLVCDLKSIRYYDEFKDDAGKFIYSVMIAEVDFK